MGGRGSKEQPRASGQQQQQQQQDARAADKQLIAQLQQQIAQLQVTSVNMAGIAIPRWRIGDQVYYNLHERIWEGAEKADEQFHGKAADPAAALQQHPSETRFGSDMKQLVFDNAVGMGDDIMLTALVIARRSPLMARLSLVNTGLTDIGVDFLASALRAHPGQAPETRFTVLNIDLSGNPNITAYGVRRLFGALMTRTGEPRSVSLRDCNRTYVGSAEDVASVELLATQLAKDGATLVLPDPPEVPFDVDGHHVKLSQFVRIGGDYRPVEVEGRFLHREDIVLKDEAKANKLAEFLMDLSSHQARAPPGCGFDPKAFHGGPQFLCRVRFVQHKAKTTVVVVADGVVGKTFAERMAEVSNGFVFPRRLKLQVFFQICNAASYIHEHGFALRQMRPDLLAMQLERGVAWCRYMDYSPLRPEAVRTAKVQTGSHMTFTDPSIRAGDVVSRNHDLYAIAMLCVYAYIPCDNILSQFQDKQYKWLIPAIAPAEEQIPLALEHYRSLGIEADIADIIVQLTRIDLDKRMGAAKAAKAFHDLLAAEPAPPS